MTARNKSSKSSAKRLAAPAASSRAVDDGFPPYGRMHRGLYGAIASMPFPEGFEPPPGKKPKEAWQAIFTPILDRLADVLWPRYQFQPGTGGVWVGGAVANMAALTDADFQLMQVLAKELHQPVSQKAAGQARLATSLSHRSFFVEEDGDDPLPVNNYLTAADQSALSALAAKVGAKPLPGHIVKWMSGHSTAPTLPAKDALQRPRPYQMASLQGRAFDYELAKSAVTSAIPSGHCIQGIQGVCMAVLELSAAGVLPSEALARLRQYAVDHGDRRVFAGVHYPSDNLASWCMALALCQPLYGLAAPVGRRFIVEAVTEHSAVYQQIRASGLSAYTPALTWFDELVNA